MADSGERRCEVTLRDEGDVEIELSSARDVLRLLSGDERYTIVSISVRYVLFEICSFALSFFEQVAIVATRIKTEKGATDAQGIVGCLLTHDGGWSRAVVSRLLCPSKNSINVESPCGARSECSSGARD